jgi:AraC-like DNA-binding protein
MSRTIGAMDSRQWTTRAPDPRVRRLLARDYCGFAEVSTGSRRWLMPPTCTVTVILNLGASFGGFPGSFVAGIQDTYSLVDYGGSFSCVDLKLTPLGAYTLLGLPMSEISGTVVDLADIVGDSRLTAGLGEASSWERCFAIVDAFLLRRAADGPEPAREVSWAWRRLLATGGRIPVGALAEEVGWSRKHLITRFRQQTGLPPKTLARIVPFSHLLRRLETGPVRWDRIAADCGYYDQAHLNRDFREFVGTTPTDFLTRREPGGGIDGSGLG